MREIAAVVYTDPTTGTVVVEIEGRQLHLLPRSARNFGFEIWRAAMCLLMELPLPKPAAIDAPAATEKVM
jgi:hypothetical protein